MHVEHRLGELIGEPAGRLHTARSRNDQVATDFKLFVRRAIDEAIGGIDALEAALLDRAEEHAATVMPGFTHLQSGQPVTLGPPFACLSRNAGARPQPLRRCARADERMPARQRGAGRDRLRHRSRLDRRRARLRPRDGQQPRRRVAIATSSSITSTPPRLLRCICRGWPKKSSCGRRSRSAS